jgi:stage V sporulation protein B
MTQQITSLRTQGKDAQIHDIIMSGVIFELVTGAILSLVCFAVAQSLAAILSTQNPVDAANLSIYISIMSLSVFAGAVLAAASGVFTGFECMKLNSITQILQAIVKTALGPLLIVLGFGVLGAIYAASISLIAGAVVAILLVYFAIFKQLRKCKDGKCDVTQTLKPMLRYGLPLMISNIVIGVLPLMFSFTMTIYAGSEMMGNYFSAAYFSVLLTFISLPISTVLFPTFSKINAEREPGLVKMVFASSFKYTPILLVPATIALISLSTPLIGTLFPKTAFCPLFLLQLQR